jgi:hypothetical protein
MTGYKNDTHFNEAIDKIIPFIQKYKDEDNLEIEFRIGYVDDETNRFDSFVCKEFFTKILNVLQTNKSWLSKDRNVTKDYFIDNMRLSVDENNNKSCMSKQKLCVLDFRYEDTPFDIRICFSKEIPIQVSKFPKKKKDVFVREKDRVTYKHKTWNYDITSVKTIDNTVESTNFEFELEADLKESLTKMKPSYFLHSSLLKIKDIVNMCEKVEDGCKLELLNIREFT